MPERPVPPHDHTRFSRGGKLTSAAITGLTTGTGGTSGGGGSSGGGDDHGGLSGLTDDDHLQYRLDDSWFDVRRYGATGDGTTDDTASVNSAIAALVAYGSGVLYFPAGTYEVNGALTALSVPCLVLGDGSAFWDGDSDSVSRVLQLSDTAVTFTVTTDTARFEALAIVNSHASPSAGAGIQVSGGATQQRCDFEGLVVAGFYVNVDIQIGNQWVMHGCMLTDPVLYALKIRNTANGDAGDWAISDSGFIALNRDASAAIRIESSGGGKIVNSKINGNPTTRFNHGIDLAIGTGTSTSVLLIANTSIENVDTDAIHGTTSAATSTYGAIVIDGCQFGLYGNNAGRCLSLVATTAGDFNKIIFGANVCITDGTARAAVAITNVDYITFGDAILDGFNALYTQTTSTNIVDNSAAGSASFATPAIVLGTAAAAGAASTVIRSDSTIVAFDATVPTTAASADAAATGSAAVAARRDHRHGMPTLTPGIGEILISDTPSTPLVFADLIQNEAQDDLVYGDP